MPVNPEELLKRLRGQGSVCACGRLLSPVFDSTGKQIGMTHRGPGDEDYHIWYFTGCGLNPETNEYEEGFNPYGQDSLIAELAAPSSNEERKGEKA